MLRRQPRGSCAVSCALAAKGRLCSSTEICTTAVLAYRKRLEEARFRSWTPDPRGLGHYRYASKAAQITVALMRYPLADVLALEYP